MGKLHKLRKAIERNPRPWYMERPTHTWTDRGWLRSVRREATGAFIDSEGNTIYDSGSSSYRPFVRHVLKSLNIDVK